jgi:hypothetical protein
VAQLSSLKRESASVRTQFAQFCEEHYWNQGKEGHVQLAAMLAAMVEMIESRKLTYLDWLKDELLIKCNVLPTRTT